MFKFYKDLKGFKLYSIYLMMNHILFQIYLTILKKIYLFFNLLTLI